MQRMQQASASAGAAGTQVAQSYVYVGHVVREQLRQLSDEAAEYYQRLHDAGLHYATTFGEVFRVINFAEQKTRETFSEAQAQLESYLATLKSGVGVNDDFLAAVERSIDGMRILGEQRLQPLRDALEGARRRLRDMRDEAADVLRSIQDELDELSSNYDDIERRRGERKRAELESKLQQVTAAGDAQAIADLRRAIELQAEVTRRRVEEAERRERDALARQKEAEARERAGARPVKTVHLDIKIGDQRVGLTVPQNQGDELIRALQRAKWVS